MAGKMAIEPTQGLLCGLGAIYELAASEGCCWEKAHELWLESRKEEPSSNVIAIDFRMRRKCPG